MSYSLAADQEPTKLPVYKPIGRCRNTVSGDVAFINYKYRVQHDCVINSPKQTYSLSSHDSTLLNSARFIVIRITHTLSGGIPALKDLSIVGFPLTMDFLKKCVNTKLPATSSKIPVEIDKERNDDFVIKDSDNTPDEFVDPLTCQVMSLPVILPSGYTIDQQTLDKHIVVEKSWGRKPSDPFTGIPLNQSNPPIVHQLLKERIDRFALTNNIEVGRTTGRKRSNKEMTSNASSSNKRFMPNTTEIASSISTPPKHDQKVETDISEVKTEAIAPESVDNTISSRLTKVLAKVSSFRTVKIPEQADTRCITCSRMDREDTGLYKLKCDHLFCKICLLSLGNCDLICSKCDAITPRSEVNRYHRT